MASPFAQLQSTERLSHLSVRRRAMDCDKTAEGVRTERRCKSHLLFCREPCGCESRRAEAINKLLGKKLHQVPAVVFRRFDDLHQRRPTP